MNMRIFAESLTMQEVNELSNILFERKREFTRMTARPITSDMKAIIDKGGYIDAIKEYRAFYNASLFEAKIVIDAYRERR